MIPAFLKQIVSPTKTQNNFYYFLFISDHVQNQKRWFDLENTGLKIMDNSKKAVKKKCLISPKDLKKMP